MQMEMKSLDNGFTMPAYGLGTWMMGGAKERDHSNDDAADVRAIAAAVEAGVAHIDCAESYAAGHAESLVGQAIASFPREQVFLATKFSAKNAAAADVVRSAEASLRRLGVDYVDLYMLHSYSKNIPLAETIEAMNTLVDRGLVRSLGVSNFGVANLERAQSASAHPIVVDQVHYNLAVREVEHVGLLKHCQNNDVMLSAWRPLDFEIADGSVDSMCEKYSVNPRQIALNWLVSQPNVVTMCKTRATAHLEENLHALSFRLSPTDIEVLRSEYPDQAIVSPVVALDD